MALSMVAQECKVTWSCILVFNELMEEDHYLSIQAQRMKEK